MTTTAQITRQRSALQTEQARLLSRLAEIEAELAALALGEAVQEVLDSTPRTGGPSTDKNQGGAGWIETRMVGNCGPYAYRRWWDGNKKRSEYLGKVMTK